MDEILALQNKRLLRVDEAARLLNISRWTVYRWVEAGQLGGTRIGAGSLRIFSDTVVALINHHCVGASVPVEVPKEDQLLVKAAGTNGRRNTVSGAVGARRQAVL
jgi:excisionase family DNA binding protein